MYQRRHNQGLVHVRKGRRHIGAYGAPTLNIPVLTWTSDNTVYNPTFSMTEIIEGDVVEIEIDDNSDFSSLYDSESNTIDAAEAAAGSLTFAGISTLGFGTTYYARARYTRGADTSDWSTAVSKAMDADPAPVLSSPTDTKNGSTAMTGTVSTNEAAGTLYWFISTSATPPSAASLKAGTGATKFGSQAVSGSGVQNISASALTASTAYYTYYLHNDGTSDSSIAAADGFTTDASSTLPATGLVGAWEADDLTTLFNTITGTGAISADGDLVGTWNDRSGTGNHLTSSGNTSARPVYKTDGTYSWLAGSGAQILRRLSALTGTGLYNSGTGYTFAIALRTYNASLVGGLPDANNLAPWSEGNSASANASNTPTATGSGVDDVVMFVRGDDNATVTGTGIMDSDAYDGNDTVLIVTDNGSGQLICYEDANTTGTTRNYTRKTLTLNQFALFALARTTGAGAGFFKGRIYAAAAWTGLLSQSDRATVFTRFGAKQGRTL